MDKNKPYVIVPFEVFEQGIKLIFKLVYDVPIKCDCIKASRDDESYIWIRDSLCWWSSVQGAAHLIDRFVWELDFGREWVKSPSFGKSMKLSTIEDLYQALLGTPNLV